MSRWGRLAPIATPRVLVLFMCVLAPLFGFGVLAEDVVEKDLFFFDGPILQFMHQHATVLFDRIMVLSTRAGSALILVPAIVAVAAWLYRLGDRRRTWFWLLAVGGAALLNFLAKHSFMRVRPALWVSMLPEATYSFPSGHAMASMAFAAAAVCLLWHQTRRRLAALGCAGLFVLLVGMSRVYLGVHYPSDVMAGWLASLAWVTGLALMMRIR